MKEQLEQRLKELKEEYERGERMLADLQAQFENVKQTTLRIGGAIQVLQEELARAGQPAAVPDAPRARRLPYDEKVGDSN